MKEERIVRAIPLRKHDRHCHSVKTGRMGKAEFKSRQTDSRNTSERDRSFHRSIREISGSYPRAYVGRTLTRVSARARKLRIRKQVQHTRIMHAECRTGAVYVSASIRSAGAAAIILFHSLRHIIEIGEVKRRIM